MTSRRAHGDGSVHKRQRDGLWVATIELPRGLDGKRRRKSFTARTQHEVRAKLRAAQREVEAGRSPSPRSSTVGELLDWWLSTEILPSDRSQSTKVGHEANVRLHLRPVLGHHIASRLDPLALRSLLQGMKNKCLSSRTQQSAVVTLKSAFKYAVDNGVLDRNPIVRVRPPRPECDPERVHDIPVERLVRILQESRNEPLHALWVLLATTGVRKGEALAWRWQDVDLDALTIRTERSLYRLRGGGLEVKTPKTANARRTLAIPQIAADALRAHRSRQASDRLAAGTSWVDQGFVFCGATGQPLDLKVPNRELHRICRRLGLPPERVHNLRHSVATLGGVVAQGDMHSVSKQLGHASISTTVDMYRHAVTAAQRALADGIGVALEHAHSLSP
jgi:integrase